MRVYLLWPTTVSCGCFKVELYQIPQPKHYVIFSAMGKLIIRVYRFTSFLHRMLRPDNIKCFPYHNISVKNYTISYPYLFCITGSLLQYVGEHMNIFRTIVHHCIVVEWHMIKWDLIVSRSNGVIVYNFDVYLATRRQINK